MEVSEEDHQEEVVDKDSSHVEAVVAEVPQEVDSEEVPEVESQALE